MPFCCEKCKKTFRDRYDLNRHLLKKNPCISTQEFLKNDTKRIRNILQKRCAPVTIQVLAFGGKAPIEDSDSLEMVNEEEDVLQSFQNK